MTEAKTAVRRCYESLSTGTRRWSMRSWRSHATKTSRCPATSAYAH